MGNKKSNVKKTVGNQKSVKKLEAEAEKVELEGQSLRNFQHCFGYSIEDLELILHPMAEDAKEATGSMGDDTPLAVLSDKYRPLYHYFRQNFSQVTNPPIDSLREQSVMSLETCYGPELNIFEPSSEHAKRLVTYSVPSQACQ